RRARPCPARWPPHRRSSRTASARLPQRVLDDHPELLDGRRADDPAAVHEQGPGGPNPERDRLLDVRIHLASVTMLVQAAREVVAVEPDVGGVEQQVGTLERWLLLEEEVVVLPVLS